MHNEKPTYRAAENDDSESSSTSNGKSSFGSGPAFRPVLPVESRPIISAPEAPAAPRRVGLEGVLFDRKRIIQHHLEEKAKAEKKTESDEDSGDSNEKPAEQSETSVERTTESKSTPRRQTPEVTLLHQADGETRQDTDSSEAEQADQAVSDGNVEAPAVFTYPEMPSQPQAESNLPPLGEVRSPEQYVSATSEYQQESDPLVGHVPTTSTHHSLVPPRQPIAPLERTAFGPAPSAVESAYEQPASDEDESTVPLPTPPANPVPSYNTASSPTNTTYYNQLGNTPPPTPALGGNTPPPMGPPPTHSFGANPNMFPPVPNPHNPNLYPPSGGSTASPNIAPPAPSSQVIEQRNKGNPWPYVAVLAERFARRRADKKLEGRLGSRIDRQAKTQESMQASQRNIERQQEQVSAFQTRQEANARRNRTAEWGTAATVTAASHPGESVHAQSTLGPQPELRPMTPIQNTAEQQLLENAAPIELAPHQHLEHSAWHTVVVDERGREVSGAINYGNEFNREREQEAIPDRIAAGAVPSAGSGGGPAGGGSSSNPYGQIGAPYGYTQNDMRQGALPSGMTTPGLPQGHPTHVDPQHQLPQHTQKRTNSVMPGPVFWVMALLIILAFFAAAML